jgi:hypothetical protein
VARFWVFAGGLVAKNKGSKAKSAPDEVKEAGAQKSRKRMRKHLSLIYGLRQLTPHPGTVPETTNEPGSSPIFSDLACTEDAAGLAGAMVAT